MLVNYSCNQCILVFNWIFDNDSFQQMTYAVCVCYIHGPIRTVSNRCELRIK